MCRVVCSSAYAATTAQGSKLVRKNYLRGGGAAMKLKSDELIQPLITFLNDPDVMIGATVLRKRPASTMRDINRLE